MASGLQGLFGEEVSRPLERFTAIPGNSVLPSTWAGPGDNKEGNRVDLQSL